MVHIAREGMIPAMLESERQGKEGGAWHMAHALCASEWPAPIRFGPESGGGGKPGRHGRTRHTARGGEHEGKPGMDPNQAQQGVGEGRTGILRHN